METIFAYEVEKIKYRGQSLFPKGHLYDGCKSANVMFADLEKLFGNK
jgi:hypothetical protein